ncbi:MAG: GNAT family N-acetyltransferase [Pseudonocardiaceae bacterium]
MNTAPAELAIQCHDAEGMQQQKADLLAVYQEVYVERLSDPFFFPERFWDRLEGYASRDGFRLVTGRLDGELIGFTLGETLPARSGWWRGFKGAVDLDLLRETGTRTFAINELMVRPPWRHRGYAQALSSALLEDRPEERAALLVRAENTAAYTAYQSWGFQTIGQVRPFDDSPLYEAMMRTLAVNHPGV